MKDRVITVQSFENQYEAMYAKDFLKENGIEASVSDENMVQLFPMFASPFGGIRLNVFEKDREKAEEILKQLKINRQQ